MEYDFVRNCKTHVSVVLMRIPSLSDKVLRAWVLNEKFDSYRNFEDEPADTIVRYQYYSILVQYRFFWCGVPIVKLVASLFSDIGLQ